jgi:hypothetical protein
MAISRCRRETTAAGLIRFAKGELRDARSASASTFVLNGEFRDRLQRLAGAGTRELGHPFELDRNGSVEDGLELVANSRLRYVIEQAARNVANAESLGGQLNQLVLSYRRRQSQRIG